MLLVAFVWIGLAWCVLVCLFCVLFGVGVFFEIVLIWLDRIWCFRYRLYGLVLIWFACLVCYVCWLICFIGFALFCLLCVLFDTELSVLSA